MYSYKGMRNEEELLTEEMERQRVANYDFECGDVKYCGGVNL